MAPPPARLNHRPTRLVALGLGRSDRRTARLGQNYQATRVPPCVGEDAEPARPAAVASLSLRARTFSYSFYVKSSS